MKRKARHGLCCNGDQTFRSSGREGTALESFSAVLSYRRCSPNEARTRQLMRTKHGARRFSHRMRRGRGSRFCHQAFSQRARICSSHSRHDQSLVSRLAEESVDKHRGTGEVVDGPCPSFIDTEPVFEMRRRDDDQIPHSGICLFAKASLEAAGYLMRSCIFVMLCTVAVKITLSLLRGHPF